MMPVLNKEDVQKLVGKEICAVTRDGTLITGRLSKIKGNQVFVKPANPEQAKTTAFVPLVLFDLLAIGTYGGYGGYPYGYGFGYPYFW